MIRRSRPSIFAGNEDEVLEDADPRTGLVNLSDIMLVLAVAIMVALLSHFGVSGSYADVDEDELEAVDAEEAEVTSEDLQDEGRYEEAGTVYRDTETGELYVLED